jgi:hypothetical protein
MAVNVTVSNKQLTRRSGLMSCGDTSLATEVVLRLTRFELHTPKTQSGNTVSVMLVYFCTFVSYYTKPQTTSLLRSGRFVSGDFWESTKTSPQCVPSGVNDGTARLSEEEE